MVETAINLYSVRELDEPLPEILERVAAAGYDGVQFSGGLRDEDPAAVADLLADLGLDATPAHVDYDALREAFDDAVATYRDALGCAGAVIPWFGPERWADADAVAHAIADANAVHRAADETDWDLHYHNHAHEFAPLGDGTAFDRFVAETEVGIELDVGWALVGGVDPATFIDAHADRIDVVHLKDIDVEEEAFREIGEGDVDVAACADAARDADASWLVYEHDEPADPAASIETGAAFLADL